MLRRKRTIIQPVKPDGLLGPQILAEKSVWQQLWEFVFGFSRDMLTIWGLISLFIFWSMGWI